MNLILKLKQDCQSSKGLAVLIPVALSLLLFCSFAQAENTVKSPQNTWLIWGSLWVNCSLPHKCHY